MKKFLLSMAAVAVLGITANATSVTFNFEENSYGLPEYNEDLGDNTPYVMPPATITQGNVSITFYGDINGKTSAWRMWKDGLRAYSKRAPYFTVSTNDGQNITGVEIDSKGTFAVEGTSTNVKAWAGSEPEVTFVYTSATPEQDSKNLPVVSITVYYGEEFTPVEPTYENYTVAQALDALSTAGTNTIDAIVTGIVAEVGTFNASFGSLTYEIVDKIGDFDQLQIYAGLGLNGEKFANANALPVGTTVKVKGTLKNYTNNDGVTTPEMDMNSEIVELTYPEGYTPSETPDAPEGTITVAEALGLVADGYTGEATVAGYIVDIQEVSIDYGNATYTIADSATDSAENGLLVYRGYNLDNEKFTSEDQLEIGAFVTVTGTLVDYKGTYEFTTGSHIVSYEPAGVEGIEVDLDAPAVYYNLQGVRVANPVKGGIYIVNGKKVLVK